MLHNIEWTLVLKLYYNDVNKVVNFVALFVCPIITLEPLDRFASSIDLGTWESHGNGFSLVLRS